MLDPQNWVKNYGDYLFSIAMLKTNNEVVSQDLVQDTFLAALKAKETFKNESSEKTWLISILKNKVIDYYRKSDVLKDTSEYLVATEESFIHSFFEERTLSKAHWQNSKSPVEWNIMESEKVFSNEFQKIIEYCINKMPPKFVPLFVMKYIDEIKSSEICKELEISSSNYWIMIHRAKLLMRACIEKNWFLKQ